mgnify:CR=1 FL=1
MAAKNSKYWSDRMREMEDENYRRSLEYYKDVQKQFRKASSDLQSEIELWYSRLEKNNGVSYAEAKKMLSKKSLEEFKWNVDQYIKAGRENAIDQRWMTELENASARYHISYLEAMKLQIQHHAEMLSTEFEGGMTDFLHNRCVEQFYRTAWEISKGCGAGYNLARLDERRIDMLIKHSWAQDGKNFSDRIWSNKEKLVNNLHTELAQCIIRGESPRSAIDRLAKKMDVSKAQAGNLIMTESAAIASAAQEECYKELGVERYQIDATLDGVTCENCQGMDQIIFKMSEYEVGVTVPPFHPRCRCCTTPYFDDWEEFGINPERATREPETGKIVYVDGNMKYKEWKEVIDGSGDFQKWKERKAQDNENQKRYKERREEWKRHHKELEGEESAQKRKLNLKEEMLEKYGVEVNIEKSGQYKSVAEQNVGKLKELLKEYDSTTVSYSVVKNMPQIEGGSAYMMNGKTSIQISAGVLRRNTATDQLRLGENQIFGVTYHEFAHSLSQSREKINPDFWKEIRKIKREYDGKRGTANWLNEKISTYADKDADEFFAEAFTQAKLAEKPSPYAMKVLEVTDKYFKKTR